MKYHTIDELVTFLKDSRHSIKSRSPIVLVTGPSGSGKTTLCQSLTAAIPSVTISIDWWLIKDSPTRHREIIDYYNEYGTFPCPLEWYDWTGFKQGALALQKGDKLVLEKAWNQETGLLDTSQSLQINPGEIIFAEGMYMQEARNIADYVVVLDCDIEKSHAVTRTRQKSRMTDEYLDIKHLWHQNFDAPYYAEHQSAEDIHILSFLERDIK